MSAHQLVRLEYHDLVASEGLAEWLQANDVTLVFTNGARVFCVGTDGAGALRVAQSQYGAASALHAVDSETLLLATRYQLWLLKNALQVGTSTDDGFDRLFLPQTAWTTGAIGITGIGRETNGRTVFVSSLFSCIATLSETLNFRPLWSPPWISEIVAEDRCGLTGVALVDGAARYVTSASRLDAREAWRHDTDSGVVVDLADNEVVASGLSRPRSPVFDDDDLWLCNRARGEVGVVDVARDAFTVVAKLPGYTEGLARLGRWAVVGTSRPAWASEVDPAIGADARTAVHIVDVTTGNVAHSLEVHGVALEIGSIALLKGVKAAKPVAFTGDDVEQFVTIPD